MSTEENKIITINVSYVACELAHSRTFDEFRDILEEDEINMYKPITDENGDTSYTNYKNYIQESFNMWYSWYEENLISLKQ
tara:strand:- start:973 stop:1215 length:243 start_codon:yes stop_codon:yes gene_type:complete